MIPPNQGLQPSRKYEADEADSSSEEDPDNDEEGPRPSGRGRWFSVIAVLAVLILLVGGGWWGYNKIQENYYLAVDEQENFVIHQGADFSVFGAELNDPLQQACINRAGNLRFVDLQGEDQSSSSCSVFGLQDLPESARTSVDGLDGGSYDDVTLQLRRLSDQALPVCLTRESEDAEGEPTAGDLNQPGVNCREVS